MLWTRCVARRASCNSRKVRRASVLLTAFVTAHARKSSVRVMIEFGVASTASNIGANNLG
jgi:hypothetical protein